MLKLQFDFETNEEAHHVLNAQNYYNLLSDLYYAIRNARKYGDNPDTEILKVVESFMPELTHAIDHPQGAY